MPSLFDNDLQQYTGLLGEPRKKSFLSRVLSGIGGAVQSGARAYGSLYTGGDDPNLSPEQNDAIRRQAMMMGGLTGLASSQQWNGPQGVGGAVQGMLVGQKLADSAQEKALAQQKLQQQVTVLSQQLGLPAEVVLAHIQAGTLDSLMSQGWGKPPEPVKPVIATASKNGVTVSNVPLGDVPKVLAAIPGESKDEWITVGGTADIPVQRKFPNTPEGIREAEAYAQKWIRINTKPTGTPVSYGAPEWMKDEQGNPVLKAWNPRAGRYETVDSRGIAPPAGKAADLRPRILTGMVGPAIKTVQDYMRKHGAPPRGMGVLPREMQNAEFQLFQQAGDAVAGIYTFLISGVTSREEEFQRSRRFLIGLAGEKPPVVKTKIAALDTFNNLLEDPSKWHPTARAYLESHGGQLPPELQAALPQLNLGEFDF